MNNIEIINEMLVQLVILVPLATGVTEVIKRALALESNRFLPLISTIVGGGFGALLLGVTVPAVVVGVIAGLAGTGLWEFGKTTVAGK